MASLPGPHKLWKREVVDTFGIDGFDEWLQAANLYREGPVTCARHILIGLSEWRKVCAYACDPYLLTSPHMNTHSLTHSQGMAGAVASVAYSQAMRNPEAYGPDVVAYHENIKLAKKARLPGIGYRRYATQQTNTEI